MKPTLENGKKPLSLGLILGSRPSKKKKAIISPDAEFYAKSCSKKLFEKVNFSRRGAEICQCIFGQSENLGLNCPLGPAQRVNTNSHTAYSIRILP